MRKLLFISTIFMAFFMSGTIVQAAENAEIPQHVATTPDHRLNEDWWKNRYEEKLAQAKNGDIDVIFLGDSITHFWDGRSQFKKYYGDRKVLNIGFSGDRTEHVLWRLDEGCTDGLSPKMIMMMIGTNNIGHGTSTPAQAVDGIRAILDRLKKKHPDAKILLLAVFPRDEKPDGHLRLKANEINAALPALADGENVVFLDLSEKFLQADGVMSREIMPDFLHPGDAGYEIWAQAVEPFFAKWVGKPKHVATIPEEKTDEWWQNRHKEKVAQAKTGDVELVFLGDSITHGWEGNPVFKKYYADRKVLNLGNGWERTEHALWRLENGAADGYSAKVIMVMLGTNNIGHGTATPAQTADGIRAVVELLRKKQPAAKILLLPVFPRGETPDDPMRLAVNEINENLSALADGENVFFMDISEKFLESDGTISREIMPDFLHPTEAGYEIWAEAVEPFFLKWAY